MKNQWSAILIGLSLVSPAFGARVSVQRMDSGGGDGSGGQSSAGTAPREMGGARASAGATVRVVPRVNSYAPAYHHDITRNRSFMSGVAHDQRVRVVPNQTYWRTT